MTTKSKYRGHEIEFVNNEWIYADNKQPVAKTYKHRDCGNCGENETKEGHDHCLGALPGTMNACCGHGVDKDAYIQFLDGFAIHGLDALKIMNVINSNLK